MTDEFTSPNFRLADLVTLLRRRWRVAAGVSLAVVAAVLALSLSQPSTYQATARVLVQAPNSDTGLVSPSAAENPFFPDRSLQNVIQVVESTAVRAAVDIVYDGPISVDDVTALRADDGSDSIDITALAGDADEVATLVNTYAATYISFSEETRLETLLTAINAINEQLAVLGDRRAETLAPLEALEAQLVGDPNNAALANQFAFLTRQIGPQLDSIDLQRSTFQASLQNLALAQDLTGTQSAQLVRQADVPTSPVSPKPVRDGIIGLMLGLGLGVATAIAREFLDESVRTVDDLERITSGVVPTLGVVPFVQSGGEIVTLTRPTSISAEAYRALRTSVRFLSFDRSVRVVQVTSPASGDGKSTTVANLAVALAQAGHRVAAISCDLRRPTLHTLFDTPLSPGFTDVVVGECPLSEAIRATDSGVWVLPAGSRPPNPSELLGSSRTEAVFRFLADEFDFVIVDATPLLPVTDAIVVSRFVEATILVVAARDSSRSRVRHALNLLGQASAPVIGTVLNKLPVGHREGYDYLYTEGDTSTVPTPAGKQL